MESFSFAGLFAGGSRGGVRLPAAGERLSAPVPVPFGGRVLDGVFSFSGDGRAESWVLTDPQSGEVLRYSHCAAEALCEPGRALPEGPVSLDEPFTADPERARGELGQLLEVLRPFLFAGALTPDQEALRTQYRELFLQLTPAGQLPHYRALSPPFFDWLGIGGLPELPGEPPAELAGAEILERLEGLEALFREKIARDRHKETLFDQLHAELQDYRNGLLDALTRPMEEDVIKVIDDIDKTMELYRSRPFTPDNYRRLFALFEGVRTDLCDLLYRHGIEPFSGRGELVEPGRQKVLDTLPAQRPEQDKTIARRHSPGWEKDGRVLRPERVSVYLYTPEQPGEPSERAGGSTQQ